MSGRCIYLDCAATTPVDPEVLEAILPQLREVYGNPSSVHSRGREARDAIDQARDRVAHALGCEPREVVFGSGGSEANNLALRGAVERYSCTHDTIPHVVTTAIEHEAVLATCEQLADSRRAEVTVIGCDASGRVDPHEVADSIRETTAVVSVMLANNEVGTIQDVAEVARLVRQRNQHTLIHTDSVQALGKLPIRVAELGVDMLSVSAHKVYGPKGVGALYVRHGVVLSCQITGGGQERRRRAGTENVAGIVGFGRAAELAESRREQDTATQQRLCRRLSDAIVERLSDTVLTGSQMHRLPNIASFAFPSVIGEVLVTALDGEGICASAGSACSSGATLPSHVLSAMGLPPELAQGALRCSVGRLTTADEIDQAAAAIVTAVLRLRQTATAR